jgi:major membrane immunogen (membrane-anchored lipoprotein)
VSRRILAGRGGVLASLGVLLVFVLALGALLTGCGGSENEADTDVPPSPDAADNVVVRVSGTEGIAYSGTYGTIEGTLETVDDTVGSEPKDYDVEVQEGVSDGVTAGFQKTEPGQGELKVQILGDEKVVVESRTLAEFGAVNADWFPQIGPPEQIPPDDEMILPDDEEIPPEDKEVTSGG